MKAITADERKAAITAWLETRALMEAALTVAVFISQTDPEAEGECMRQQREEAIACLPDVLRVMKERLEPAATVLVNYDFTIQEPAHV